MIALEVMAAAIVAVVVLWIVTAGDGRAQRPAPKQLGILPLATRLDLEVRGARLVGRRGGRLVAVYPPSHVGGGWTVIVDHTVPLVPGSEGEVGIDDDGRMTAHVDRTYVSVTSTGASGGESDDAAIQRGIGAALGLLDQLGKARRDYVAALARALGLPVPPGHVTALEGEVRGCTVSVVLPRRLAEAWELVVRGALHRTLPPGTRLRAAASGVADVDLGDLFLDRLLAIESSDVDALRVRLARDEVRGPLLDLVQRFRGSEVTEDGILHVVRDPEPPDVLAAVDRVVELADAIG
ncbi:MAG: hypothetical protein AAF602_00975 [Myxococcota bacterium]